MVRVHNYPRTPKYMPLLNLKVGPQCLDVLDEVPRRVLLQTRASTVEASSVCRKEIALRY